MKRSAYDEKMLNLIRTLCGPDKTLCIYDARPKLNAIGSKFMNGGYENTANYQRTELFFCNIQNIHQVRDSYKKLTEICMKNKSESAILSGLDGSQWFQHIQTIL